MKTEGYSPPEVDENENFSNHARDIDLKKRLGIPLDAERVLVFGESSHWDPNWLFTSDQYYRWRIRRILDLVIEELKADPRRIFSIESLFFLQRYWEDQPNRQEELRQLFNQGRLRLTGSGITTPDVTLPDPEAILRDYLLGQEWLRQRGILAEPRLAYLPDDFGYSPALPSILRSLGFEMTGITRIDGMYFVGTDFRRRSNYPLPGSNAARLLEEHRTLDFVWRSVDGAEVLCHWNAFTYFQGDLLAHVGIIRWMGLVFGLPWRTRRHVDRRIRGFVRQLMPLARTPYMFCPIGCDFNGPIHDLLGLLDRYNRTSYPDTGIYAINAGLDDYLDLVNLYRERLPVLELDPNPYWMGFYSSRPDAKRLCNRIARKLVLAERLSAFKATQPGPIDRIPSPSEASLVQQLEKGWELLVLSNHHDFITGTSPDRVWEKEQLPWLTQAESLADGALENAGLGAGASVSKRHSPPIWRLQNGRLEVETSGYRAVLAEKAGGCLVSMIDVSKNEELLAGPGNDLVGYRESGGLWRMGHEYLGGRFREKFRASQVPAQIHAEERDGLLQVRVESILAGKPFVRWCWFSAGTPIIRMRIEGTARRHLTITCRFPTRLRSNLLAMDVPGGVAVRPQRKLYEPTFWPGRSFIHLHDLRSGSGLAAFLGGPATATLDDSGTVEWVALRNAPREMAFRILPIVSHPASGRTDDATIFNYAVCLTAKGDWRQNQLPRLVRQVLHRAWLFPGEPDLDALADCQVYCDQPEVLVTTFKPASRGQGFIARLSSYAAKKLEVHLICQGRTIRKAFLCDARERDLVELPVAGGEAVVPVLGSISSVRLLF